MIYVTEPERLGETKLPDGRLLGWAEWGPANGVPVLLSPGAATSRRLGFGAEAVHPLGVRLISVDRPGLGVSAPSPGRTFKDFAADLGEFITARDLGAPVMVGNSQGAPFALACAAEGLLSALSLVSGSDEVAAPEFAEALPPDLRGMVDRAVRDPAGAERFFRGLTADAMLSMVMDGSPESDLQVYSDPVFAASYRRALSEGFAQGPDSYARDTVLAMGRWQIDLASINVPVDLWYGEEDTSHSPDNGVTLTARIPGAVRHTVPGIGGAVLWTEPAAILRSALKNATARP